ncbi:hypothetical protein BTJ39_10190 [Izhakiella australiensis]|uniref:YrhK domain-containing protein n=1 Tax=Izhakiella australiensis TaxID=1926881 RepID=A0A1S8YNN9_9GAMM|nr:YrhK family protein [Izhakiella australiensis]OON40253.1 hypothetical protein BTJ39_10190 [Izhakiella australiensis]
MKQSNTSLTFGPQHVIIRHRYKALGAVNDLLIAVWFLIGSMFFFSETLMESGTWLFVAGSIQLILKPAITLSKLIHVRRLYRRSSTQYNPQGFDCDS